MRVHAHLLLAGLLVIIAPQPAPAQVTRVTVRVDGLSCPFCAYSLEKKLGNVEGVHELVIDVAEGTASITPADDTPVDFPALPRAVRDAGFTPREIRARGVGRVVGDGEDLRLAGPDGRPLFVLAPTGTQEKLLDAGDTLVQFDGVVLLRDPDDGGDPQSIPKLALATAAPAGES